MRITRSKILTAFLLTIATAVVLPDLANALPLTLDQKCRSTIERRARRYLTASMFARQKCLKQIYNGQMSAAVDCIEGNGDIKLATKLLNLRNRISVVLPKKCTNVDLSLLGYPGPCSTRTESFSEEDLERCIIDGHDANAARLLKTEFPPEGFVAPELQRCVNAVGRYSVGMVKGDMYARQGCLFADETNPFVTTDCREDLPPYGAGTLDPTVDDRIRRSHVQLLSGVPASCGTLDISSLDYTDDCEDVTGGAFTVFDLKFCIYDDHRTMINQLVEISFPSDPVCGDGNPNGDEECDDGNKNNNDSCTNNCMQASCGDGVVQSGVEACDDGNQIDSDACLSNCIAARCGDSIVQAGVEDCDDGNNNNADRCLNDCSGARCGDDVECSVLACNSGPSAGPEDCDDGNRVNDDLCGNDCGLNFCGDGDTQAGLGEQCDDGVGNGNSPDACRFDCRLPNCGDGIVDPGNGEDCDDGNSDPDDACDGCQFVLCGNGMVDAANEECDDGNDSNNDNCLNNCSLNSCGDGFLHVGSEACDDGNASNNDPCLNDCTDNVCGDGFVNMSAESCDDGNASQTDACLNDCTNNTCGDGFVNGGVEDCDDGSGNSNTVPGACRTNCNLPSCGDGVTDPSNGEECDNAGSNSNTVPDACRTDCSAAGCGDGVKDSGEECDGSAGVCDGGSACGSRCACANECPSVAEAVVFAGTGKLCSSDAECGPGTCSDGRCRTGSRLDSGWTGIAHGADVTDQLTVRAFLNCGSSAPCGECDIVGLDPSPGYCRCANDNQTSCFNPLKADNDSCGGALCECYLGPPLALSAGNTPACVVNKIREDIFGTGNVDTGEGALTTQLASVAYLGQNLVAPCPYCEGDVTINDGVRDGVCVFGANEGESCDSNATHTTFPAPGGGGHSIDCFPLPGKNVSGTGLKITFTQTTGTSSIGLGVTCGFPPFIAEDCHCGICSNDGSVACTGDAECPSGGTCGKNGNLDPRPNQCNDTLCEPVGDGTLGTCTLGPSDLACDAIVRADGRGFINCLGDADCKEDTIGIPAGNCTLVSDRSCFLDTITATGKAAPSSPLGAATFCIPPTSNPGINTVAGLPGPARVVTQAATKSFCASDETAEYTPGVGGCP